MVEQTAMNPNASYEHWVSQQGKQWESDKSFVDKLLSRQDSDFLKDLIKKDNLSREDMSELLSIITLTGSKLVNYNEWDRYTLGKYFTWIDGFVNLSMGTIGIQEMILKMLNEINNCLYDVTIVNDVQVFTMKTLDEKQKLSLLWKRDLYLVVFDVLLKCRNMQCDDVKYLINLFLYMSNSTLSIGAAAFDTLSQNRFEYSYPSGGFANVPMVQSSNEKKNFWSFLKK